MSSGPASYRTHPPEGSISSLWFPPPPLARSSSSATPTAPSSASSGRPMPSSSPDLRKRLAKFGWRCTPTRPARSSSAASRHNNDRQKAWETRAFDFLGFTLVRHTIAKRMRAKLVEIKEALNRMRHVPVPEQGRWLGQVVRGYLAYHAVPTNSRKITSFQYHVAWHWRRALSRRSRRAASRRRGWGGSPRVGCHPPGSAIPGRNTASSSNTCEVGAECVSSARSDLSGGAG